MKALFFLSLLLYYVAFTHQTQHHPLTTKVHYHSHSVLRYRLTDEAQIKLVEGLGVDVWSHDSDVVVGLNDIMVSPAQRAFLRDNGILPQEVILADVEKVLANERDVINKLANEEMATWFESYHPLDDIFAFYTNLSSSFSDLTTIRNIGTSVENRPLIGFTLGTPAKKKIFIQGGQHAREWVSHSTVAYIVDKLLRQYGIDPVVTQILDNTQIVVVPVVNVDGYVYTWTSTRLWRKNRRANSGGSYGVDLNRNWDDHWGGEGSSSNPTSDTYHGTAPFSEPETQAASQFYYLYSPYGGAIDYHSYSQLILRPYGWTRTPPPNEAEAKRVGDGIRDTIRATTGTSYTSEASWELYFTAGTAQDWFYAAGKAPLAYPYYSYELCNVELLCVLFRSKN